MTNHALLNNADHKDVRIITEHSPAFGDNVMYAGTFPFEFRNVQADYPILFYKDEAAGQYHAVALFGFERGENLFLGAGGWDASYIPLSIKRQPFLIGFDAPDGGGNPVVHIDMDSPRVSRTEGEPVFMDPGGPSPYLQQIASVLDAIHAGAQQSQTFIRALQDLGLLEPLTLDIELEDGSKNRLVGFHTINEDKVAALDVSALGALQEQGFLLPLHMVLASLSQMQKLIARKNARLGG